MRAGLSLVFLVTMLLVFVQHCQAAVESRSSKGQVNATNKECFGSNKDCFIADDEADLDFSTDPYNPRRMLATNPSGYDSLSSGAACPTDNILYIRTCGRQLQSNNGAEPPQCSNSYFAGRDSRCSQ